MELLPSINIDFQYFLFSFFFLLLRTFAIDQLLIINDIGRRLVKIVGDCKICKLILSWRASILRSSLQRYYIFGNGLLPRQHSSFFQVKHEIHSFRIPAHNLIYNPILRISLLDNIPSIWNCSVIKIIALFRIEFHPFLRFTSFSITLPLRARFEQQSPVKINWLRTFREKYAAYRFDRK